MTSTHKLAIISRSQLIAYDVGIAAPENAGFAKSDEDLPSSVHWQSVVVRQLHRVLLDSTVHFQS